MDERLAAGYELLEQQQAVRALAVFDALHEDDARSTDALLGRVAALLGMGERQLTVTPEDAELWHTKGTILARLEKWYDAADALAVAVECDPTNADAWTHKGRIHLYQGLPGEALTAFDRALALQPHSRAARKGKWEARRAWVVTYVWHILPDLLGG